MSDLYEELEQLFSERDEEGLSTMALVSLPRPVRIVVQMMLRNRGEMTYSDLLRAMETQPESRRLSQAEVDEVLEAMTRLDLMIRSEQKKAISYKVNLGSATTGTRAQAQPGSQRSQEARERANDVWDTLAEEPQKKPSGGWLARLFGKRRRNSDDQG